MHTTGEVFSLFKSRLSSIYDPGEAEQIAVLSFGHVLNYSRIDIFMRKDVKLDAVKFIELERILSELAEGKPVQYVLGHTWFYGMNLHVNSDVLIPRRETEELVDWIVGDVKKKLISPLNIIDFCTGSGCIALALKREFPLSRVIAIDASEKALEVAKSNAARLNLEIDFMLLDVFHEELDISSALVVSNPPYVTPDEKRFMHSRVTDYEPPMALFVPENDPLVFYSKIAGWSYRHLLPGSNIYFEINEMMGESISELHSQIGFMDLTLRNDMQGKDRMFRATKP